MMIEDECSGEVTYLKSPKGEVTVLFHCNGVACDNRIVIQTFDGKRAREHAKNFAVYLKTKDCRRKR